MPIYDYSCPCGAVVEDVYWRTYAESKPAVMCPKCGQETAQRVIGTRNFIHPSHSGLYGRPEPALGGDVIVDYAHKQRVLRQYGAQEASDRVHGAKLYQDAVPAQPQRPKPSDRLRWAGGPPE